MYIIISGLRNAYRITTNKCYSPMSRALIESTLDPLLFLYNSFTSNDERDIKFWSHFGFIIFCLSVISFFSLVYNDFIILYCCKLEYNTYSEITHRLYLNSNSEKDESDDESEDEFKINENKDACSESSYAK